MCKPFHCVTTLAAEPPLRGELKKPQFCTLKTYTQKSELPCLRLSSCCGTIYLPLTSCLSRFRLLFLKMSQTGQLINTRNLSLTTWNLEVQGQVLCWLIQCLVRSLFPVHTELSASSTGSWQKERGSSPFKGTNPIAEGSTLMT